jgi:hypothetical protein
VPTTVGDRVGCGVLVVFAVASAMFVVFSVQFPNMRAARRDDEIVKRAGGTWDYQHDGQPRHFCAANPADYRCDGVDLR